jgi:endogenous inhibitor of DNA gyrase (YacG/DUF329 family)
MSEIETVQCPHCGKPVAWTAGSKWKPFCSERCRLIDLGDWLMERNSLPGDRLPDDQETSES